jgi:hypothetical protein
VICNASLHYVNLLDVTLSALGAALRPGGALIVLDSPVAAQGWDTSGQTGGITRGNRVFGQEELDAAPGRRACAGMDRIRRGPVARRQLVNRLRRGSISRSSRQGAEGGRMRVMDLPAHSESRPAINRRDERPAIGQQDDRPAMNRRATQAAPPEGGLTLRLAGFIRRCFVARTLMSGRSGAVTFLVVAAFAALTAACAPPAPAAAPVKLAPGHLFRPTNGPVIASPIVADLDSDGALEIAVGSWDGYFYVTDVQLRDRPGWPKYSPKGFFSSPAAGDLDGDGRPEVVVGSEAGQLFAWRADGSDQPGWPVNLRHRLWASPTLLPGGEVAIAGAGQMFVLRAGGRPAKGWPRPILGWADSTLGAAEDGSGLRTVATLAEGIPDAGAVHAWQADGTPLRGFPIGLSRDSDSSPALADLDSDGVLEIVVGDDAGLIHVFDRLGRELPGFPVQTGSLIEASPAIADLDGDGSLDIVVGSWDARMYAWDARGGILPGWPITAGDQFISSAALVDLDADGLPDVVAGSKDHRLYGWNGRGEPLPGFPFDLGAFIFSSPWAGDLDADGRADIVVGANNGIHVLKDVAPLGQASWPRFHQDDANTGWLRVAP